MVHVLLTGGSGFIAAHILEQLLEEGHTVTTTVRSEDKAGKIRDAHKDQSDRLDVVIVPDVAVAGAFDEVCKTPGLEVVMHTASPFHYKWTDGQKEVIEPALNGTNGILKAIKAYAPGVKRVVITSSFAAILDEDKLEDPHTVFSERSWNPVTMDDFSRSRPTVYRLSKKFAEKAAWDFVATEKPNFDIATVCPPAVLGPVVHHFASLDNINTSNERIVALLEGKWKEEIPPTGPVQFWVDVRDTAKAHIRAMEVPEAGGKRLFAMAGYFSNREILDAVRRNFPELEDRLPPRDLKGGDPAPADRIAKYDNAETVKTLGMEWRTLEDSIVELVKTLKDRI
ncbi:NAD dependent epimerase/dehydratase family protein [Sarocladium implicatum]|nr:NAD dependent epimerase/dehydratase family protein [Sarocladium implicatum]